MISKYTKDYYLSLSYEDRIKKLKDLIMKDFNSYLIVADYYGSMSENNGGVPHHLINKEFVRGLKRRYYFKNKKNKEWLKN